MSIHIHTTVGKFAEAMRELPLHCDKLMADAASDGLDHGQRYMREIVPRGPTHRLADAVSVEGPTMIAPGHYRGSVYVDPVIAPHARFVDEGTGIDGPMHRPVTVLRPSFTNPNRRGTMRFIGSGGDVVFRHTVKIHPSAKIQAGKNFSGRTADEMIRWTRIRAVDVAFSVGSYIAIKSKV